MPENTKVVIGGAGTVGRHIAMLLEREDHDVVLIDEDPAALREVESLLDVQTLQGHAASPSVLTRAGAEEAELMLALTNSDEVNLLAAFSAKQLGARKTIARARSAWCLDNELVDFRMRLHIDLVLNPEILTAVEIIKFLDNPDALALAHFAHGRVQLRQFVLAPESEFAGQALKDIRLPEGVLVVMKASGQDVEIPTGDTTLTPGDRLTIMGQPERIPEAQRRFRLPAEAARHVTIAGGGNTGLFLAETLEGKRFSVTLVEIDPARCDLLSERLEQTRVVHGDATNADFLREERLNRSDVFIAVTEDDETNLMSCLLAKDLGTKQTITKIARPDYTPLVSKLGIDLALSPRLVMADRILTMIHRGKINAVSLLEGGKVEVIEFVAKKGAPIVGKPLSQARTPRGALIGAIVRKGQVRVPRGTDAIQPGDNVIVLALDSVMDDVEKRFEPA